MKKIYLAALLGAGLVFSACEDKLDIEQKGVITTDKFYDESDASAESAMTNAYETFALNIAGNAGIYIPYTMIFNQCSDDMYAAGEFFGDNDQFASMNEFRYDSQNEVIVNMYNRVYYAIYACNLVIDKFSPDSPVKKRVIAEARTLRAWLHLTAALLWDCPPLVDHVLAGDDQPTNCELGHDGLLKWVANECAEAATDLRERSDKSDKDGAIVATKGLAYTVQGKALLFLGDYAGAKTALKQVISSGKYALVPGSEWRDLFHIEGDGSSEKVFECNAVRNANIGDWSNQIQRSPWMQDNVWAWRTSKLAGSPLCMGDQGWGGLGIEENFAEELYANEPNSIRRKCTMLTFEEFLTELPYNSDKPEMTDEQKLADPERGIANTTGLYGQCRFLNNKNIGSPEDRCGSWYAFRNYTIYRYAEVLLMYAECCARTNDNDGAQYLKAIQERAGAPVTDFTIENVMREKRFEMWCEGVRWTDMVRLKDFNGPRLQNVGNHIPSMIDEYFVEGSEYYKKLHHSKIVHSDPNKEKGRSLKFDAAKHSYFPYPFSVIAKNPNIKQNPGWE